MGVALLEHCYDVPYKFTGTINEVTLSLGPEQLMAEEREEMNRSSLRHAMSFDLGP